MNQRYIWIVVLFTTLLGIPSVGRAQTTKQTASASMPSSDVVKVGEYQSPVENSASNAAAITEIRTHNQAGRQTATLYIRKIPVISFVGKSVATEETKVGVINNIDRTPTKVAAIGASTDNAAANDPVQRATVVAAKINQLIQDKVDANKITVSWTGENSQNQKSSPRYIIKFNEQELVKIDGDTILADTTKDPAIDALQATNRLRRLIGNASPLKEIADLPQRIAMPIALPKQIAIGPVLLTMNGKASWYGYDGSGNRTATGERYKPEGMTAAHRSLPFGTRVRVTNTRNGRSVIVRINDRGPFIRGRIIDLSAGAARVLGMMGRGIAPVRIEVLGR
ncbi:septal ring lytic transglycosylase RlpA family protein [Iningainema tapete]|uniref:Probable endolytic peptidoglycan transglycosylase RlpA n=1 Tax=Iningainema tapete BLCC-T55 TaxID=2748662 RepID=A0A8J6XHD7_9CYAN|nr:septal ring lytic transglycosylase RlpA family protein [Iningainema tapete]MBD2776870.1 septal ring lytic transglycosylase RlpA family protein [Iningainema tapete BLCC-T55]